MGDSEAANTSPQTDRPRTSFEVIANRVLFLDRPGQGYGGEQGDNFQGRSSRTPAPPAEEDPEGVEDLPLVTRYSSPLEDQIPVLEYRISA